MLATVLVVAFPPMVVPFALMVAAFARAVVETPVLFMQYDA